MLSTQIVSALTCNNLESNYQEICKEIISSELKDAEKQELIASLLYQAEYYPNHDFIYNWNTNIKFGITPPEGAVGKSDQYIDNAWLKIISIFPSVISDKKLLTSGIGKIFTAYNYAIKPLPAETEFGDCKTEHSLASKEEKLNIYLNDKSIGTSILTDFHGSGTLNFKANLKINLVTKVEHYKTYKFCCCRKKRVCCGYCKECRHSKTEYNHHSLTLEDTKQSYQYWPVIQPKIKVANKYLDTTVILVNITNFDAFSIKSHDSYFQQSNYYYDAIVIDTTYNVLGIRANKFKNRDAKNLKFEQINNSYKFYVPDSKDCKIEFGSHFYHWEQDCSKLDYSLPTLKVDTDKLVYAQNDLINVELMPKNIPIKVVYGNISALVKNQVAFKAVPEHNKITAYLDDRDYQKVIHVKKADSWNTALNLVIFCGMIYSIFLVISKYWFWI